MNNCVSNALHLAKYSFIFHLTCECTMLAYCSSKPTFRPASSNNTMQPARSSFGIDPNSNAYPSFAPNIDGALPASSPNIPI